MKTLRLYRCPACGHKMRFPADYCGRCGENAPDKNTVHAARTWVFVAAGIMLPFGMLIVALIG